MYVLTGLQISKIVLGIAVTCVTVLSSISLVPIYMASGAATIMTATTDVPTTLITPANVSANPNSNDSIYYQFWWEGVTAPDGTASVMSSIPVTGYPHLLYTTSSDPLNPMDDDWKVIMCNTLRTRYAETVFGEAGTRIVLSPDLLGDVGDKRDTQEAEYSRVLGEGVLPVVSVPTFHVSGGGPNNPFIVVVYIYTPGNPDLSAGPSQAPQ